MVVGEVKPGEIVRVKKLCGGRRQQGRLCSLGVYPGSNIKVLDASENGSCRILAKGAPITLCENMQRNITVEYVSEVLKKYTRLPDESLETVEV